jgi:hypothetical protein
MDKIVYIQLDRYLFVIERGDLIVAAIQQAMRVSHDLACLHSRNDQ